MQIFIPLAKKKKGICPNKVLTVCVHANLVQTERKNTVLNTFSIEYLLNKWENFMEIDITDFFNKNATIAQKLCFNFIKRT